MLNGPLGHVCTPFCGEDHNADDCGDDVEVCIDPRDDGDGEDD